MHTAVVHAQHVSASASVSPHHCPNNFTSPPIKEARMGPSRQPMISYEEEDALRRILAHHGAQDPDLLKSLISLLGWVRQDEKSKGSFEGSNKPPYMLALLGQMGIYGGEAIGPSPSMESQEPEDG